MKDTTMTTTSSTSTARAATVTVDLTTRGAFGLEADAQTASMKVAEWLDAQDTTTLAADYAAHRAWVDGDFEDEPESAARYAALLDAAEPIARAAAMETWANKRAELSINIIIDPRA